MLDNKERKRVRDIYSKKKSAEKRSAEKNNRKDEDFLREFPDAESFVNWWEQQYDKQGGKCHYCDTSIDLIARLIKAGQIGTRKVRKDGERGRCLELERKDPFGPYDRKNCVLACMYCNNDKSNTYGYKDYKEFFGPNRKKHFEWLENKLGAP